MKPIWAFWSLIVGLFLGAAICASWPRPSILGKLAPELVHETPTIETRTVYIYPKSVNKTLGIPPPQHVLTSIKLVDKTITAAISDTGQTTLYVRSDPRPWIDKTRHGTLEIAYGSNQDQAVTQVSYRWTFLAIKRANLFLGAEADTGHNRFIGVGIQVSW